MSTVAQHAVPFASGTTASLALVPEDTEIFSTQWIVRMVVSTVCGIVVTALWAGLKSLFGKARKKPS